MGTINHHFGTDWTLLCLARRLFTLLIDNILKVAKYVKGSKVFSGHDTDSCKEEDGERSRYQGSRAASPWVLTVAVVLVTTGIIVDVMGIREATNI